MKRQQKRHIPLKDLASELGVSISSVSRALKDHPIISLDVKKEVKKLVPQHSSQLVFYIPILYICIIYKYYMKVISLNLDDVIFGETEKIVAMMKKPRNRYLNEAIDFYNKHQQRVILESKLYKESESVRENSMNILHDFEAFDYGD